MTYVDTADLIATGIGQGANMVEFRQGVAGSSSRTVQTKLLEQVSVFDFMSTAQIAAVQSGTSTDDGAALYQALAAGRRVFLPAGTYRLEDITIPSNRTLYGEGPDATIIKLKARATVRRPLALFGTSHQRGCAYITGSNLRAISCGGHGISLCYASAGCTLTNIHIESPDEAGIAITDQGTEGTEPGVYGHHNLISNAYVINPGTRKVEAAFAVFGGANNQFINCVARDDRPSPRMTYGFEEGNGVNTADSNHWVGMVAASECSVLPTLTVGGNSTATNLL